MEKGDICSTFLYNVSRIYIIIFWRYEMNKAELVGSVATKAGLSKADAEKAVNAFTETVIEALQGGDKVSLIGFGAFEVRERAARKGRNPKTQEVIDIPASKAPAFKAGKAFKDAMK
jgi:DNA-binding protein HU-beta